MGNITGKKKNNNHNTTTHTPAAKSKPKEPNPGTSSSSIPPNASSQPSHHHSHDDKSATPSHHSNSNSHSHPSSGESTIHSKSETDKSGFSLKKVEELFDKYKEKDADEIGPEGIMQLCKDISLDPEDALVFVLAWHLSAQHMGFFSKEEFTGGLQKLGVDNISKLKSQLTNFRRDLDDNVKFKDIYRFVFGFAKEKESKIIDLATADTLLAVVLGPRSQHTEQLREFLGVQTLYKSVNLDQWMNILEFSRAIKLDLSNYDENSAWPVLLDEYCEWARKRNAKAAPS